MLWQEAVQQSGSRPWMRSKLMLCGQGQVGKTSTLNALLGKQFNPEQESTVLADTELTCEIDRQDVQKWEVLEDGRSEYSQAVAQIVAEKLQAHAGTEPEPEPEPECVREMPTPTSIGIGISQPAPVPAAPASILSEKERRRQERQRKRWQRAEAEAEAILKKFDEEMIALYCQDGVDRKLVFSVWDFSGQRIFYTLHHLYLTRYGVCVLCFNMANLVSDDASKVEAALSDLAFWLGSINCGGITHRSRAGSLAAVELLPAGLEVLRAGTSQKKKKARTPQTVRADLQIE